MTSYFVAFLMAFVVALVATMVVRNRAHAWGLLDRAQSSRKIHAKPVPRLGGIALVVGFFAPVTALLLVESGVGRVVAAESSFLVALGVGGAAIALLGLYDDLRGAGAKLKLSVQVAVAVGLYFLDVRVERISLPLGSTLELGAMALPFTVFWVVGVINALNLIDGLDGLAGGVAFFAVLTNFVLAIAQGNILLSLMMAALAGALLGFLVFNFNPASIFMGDTGSMFLGFVLATVSIKTSTKSGTAVAMLIPIIALGLPIMDTLLSIVRRSLMGRPVFSADKEHIHHRLMHRLMLSHRGAVLFLYAVCVFFGLTAMALHFANSTQSTLLLGGVVLVCMVLMRKLGYLTLNQAQTVVRARRKNLELRTWVKDASVAIQAAGTPQELWLAVRPLMGRLGAARIAFRLEETSFEVERPEEADSVGFKLSLPIEVQERTLGAFEVCWSDGRVEVDRDEELALELISDQLAEAWKRIAEIPAQGPRLVRSRS